MRKQAIWNAVHEVGIHTRAVEDLIESTLVELAEPVLVQQRHHVPLERGAAGQQRIEDGAEGVQVAAAGGRDG